MEKSQIARLCKDVEHAADNFRTISPQADITEALRRFWQIQESLYRFLEATGEECSEIIQSRSIIAHVVTALESPLAKALAHIPAIKDARDKINALLFRLEPDSGQSDENCGAG